MDSLPDPADVAMYIGLAVAAAEAVAAITPTERDDLLIGRIEKWIVKLIPGANRKKGGGSHE